MACLAVYVAVAFFDGRLFMRQVSQMAHIFGVICRANLWTIVVRILTGASICRRMSILESTEYMICPGSPMWRGMVSKKISSNDQHGKLLVSQEESFRSEEHTSELQS